MPKGRPKGYKMSSSAKKRMAINRCINKCKKGVSESAKKRASAKSSAAKKRAAVNPWLLHVKAVRAANPQLTYKEALQAASATYKKL